MPDLVGLSVTILHEGVTFTLVAPNGVVASLDASQYLDGGPCVQVAEALPEPVEHQHGRLARRSLGVEGRLNAPGTALRSGGPA